MGYRLDTTKCIILLDMVNDAQIPVLLKEDNWPLILDSIGGT